MIKMKPEYAQKLLDGSYQFGNRMVSCHDGLLVIEDNEDYYRGVAYFGTQLIDGKFQLDEEGFVCFTSVKPVIDENTRFTS